MVTNLPRTLCLNDIQIDIYKSDFEATRLKYFTVTKYGLMKMYNESLNVPEEFIPLSEVDDAIWQDMNTTMEKMYLETAIQIQKTQNPKLKLNIVVTKVHFFVTNRLWSCSCILSLRRDMDDELLAMDLCLFLLADGYPRPEHNEMFVTNEHKEESIPCLVGYSPERRQKIKDRAKILLQKDLTNPFPASTEFRRFFG
jgi:hypothetical protein